MERPSGAVELRRLLHYPLQCPLFDDHIDSAERNAIPLRLWQDKTFTCMYACRHELYSDYKAQRPPMPDAMKLAIPKIQNLLEV